VELDPSVKKEESEKGKDFNFSSPSGMACSEAHFSFTPVSNPGGLHFDFKASNVIDDAILMKKGNKMTKIKKIKASSLPTVEKLFESMMTLGKQDCYLFSSNSEFVTTGCYINDYGDFCLKMVHVDNVVWSI